MNPVRTSSWLTELEVGRLSLIFSTVIINPSIGYLQFLVGKVQLMWIFYFVKLQILNSVRVRVSTMLVKYCSIQYWFYVFSATFCRVFVKITDTENNTQPIDIQGTHEDTITGKNTRDFHKFVFIFFWFMFESVKCVYIFLANKNYYKYNYVRNEGGVLKW